MHNNQQSGTRDGVAADLMNLKIGDLGGSSCAFGSQNNKFLHDIYQYNQDDVLCLVTI